MINKLYYNYHKHDHKGNVRSLDVIVKMEDYCKRAVELGHNAIFTTNHGMQGDVFEATTLAKQYGLKLIIGCECYYVDDRKEKDKNNHHIIVVALNDEGVRELNHILSIANEDGFYYKPRIDEELLMSLNPNNFVITTSCVAGILKKEDLVVELYKKFGDNFMLETQNHNQEIQKEYNKIALDYSSKYGIKLIHGNDSHYILQGDGKYREKFLKGKGINYQHEDVFILDYPTYDTIVERYREQGILNDEQIFEALNNTKIFDKAEQLTIINEDVKLPSVSNNPKQELRDLVYKGWEKEKQLIPVCDHEKYESAIEYELDIIDKTDMENYFLLDNKIIQLGQDKYNGLITKTGRGSAPSFYIVKLLGLTNLDRVSAPCKLFPTRFMSVERILGAKSLPDIDINMSEQEPFIKATEDLLGADNCAWMIAYKPLQESSAFRLWCKANDMKISEYNEVAKNLDDYREDSYWKPIIEESKHFVGVTESISESPCSMLLYDKDVSREVGLIKINDKMCCLLDGYNCDKYKYLKNDYLQVSVWSIIRQVCEMENIPVPSIKELDGLIKDDDETWKIYEKGLTCTINQVDSDYATPLVKKYKPRSISEMSQFTAILRPGAISLLNDFLDRKEYTTGVKELDDLLDDSGHRMIFQESIMKYLIWLGVSESHSYDIIKKIAKKKFKEKELEELKAELKDGWMKQVGTIDGFEETWIVVEQASRYSFNASHSLSYAYDSVYGAYLKSHYPLSYYTVALNEYEGDLKRTSKLCNELPYFEITLINPRFRYSKAEYMFDRETNSIYKGTASIKYLNEIVANQLYELRDIQFNTFTECIRHIILNTSTTFKQLKILTKLNYFSEFGKNKKLLTVIENYENRLKNKSLKEKTVETRMVELIEAEHSIENKGLDIKEQLHSEKEYLGKPMTTKELSHNVFYVFDVDKTNLKLYQIATGEILDYKVKKVDMDKNTPFITTNIIMVKGVKKQNKKKKDGDKWITLQNEFNIYLSSWQVLL